MRLFIVILALIATAAFADDSIALKGPAFGTSYTIKIRGQAITEDALKLAITQRLSDIDERMSTWRDDSDVSRFNDSRSDEWFPVHEETAQVVRLACDLSEQTEAYFDITVRPAVRLWNFGSEAQPDFVPPTQDQLDNAKSVVGYELLETRLNPPALRKTNVALEIDLSAIAKGYAVDAVSELLLSKGIDHFMVEIGGEVRTLGLNTDGAAWRIGLEAPIRDSRSIGSVVALSGQSLATSGDYRNFFEHDGVTYSHTIDPKTARPVTHNLTAATVIANDCATADALATAMLAMGAEQGKSWAETNSITALFLTREDGRIQSTSIGSFPLAENSSAESAAGGTNHRLKMFLITTAVFAIAIVAMSIGAIIANRRLHGSCGGMAGLKDAGGNTICDMCTKPSPDCSGDQAAFAESATNAVKGE